MNGAVFIKEFYVVKILERNGFSVWNKLKIGKKVNLIYDRADPKTIFVQFKHFLFGELPEQESEIIRNFLEQGWEDAFEARICKRDEKALYDQRISIAVYITKKR